MRRSGSASVGFKAARGGDEFREATPVNTVLGQDPPAGHEGAGRQHGDAHRQHGDRRADGRQ